ncbi:MAG: hypothetical protein QGD90_00170 [Candidatus Hydrogenedentes bacterium]|nr:hypothetical protein [Candidatus Hydrogenedentota bacterium]
MGLDPKTEMIDGHKWTVCPFPARRAIQLKVRLAKAIGPAIAELIPALGSLGIDKPGVAKDQDTKGETKADVEASTDAALSAFPKAMACLAENLGEEEFTQTILDLMELSSRDDTQITPEYFDTAFAGNFAEMYKAIWFILKVNYSDFFKGLGASNIGRSLKAFLPASPQK